MRTTAFIFTLSVFFCLSSGTLLAQTYKIKQSTSINGQSISSTVYVKGSRKRTESSGMMGMGGNVADIEQCDLKRTVQVSDDKKLFFIEPFPTDPGTPTAGSGSGSATTGKATRGGTVTMTTSIVDTGEKKQMFGLTARRIKTTMTIKSSPDACDEQDVSIESDGWYVDLPAFNCQMTMPKNPFAGMSEQKRGCTDRTIFRSSGTAKMGFALSMSQKFKLGGEDDADMPAMTQSMETLEFSKAPLDDALFDVPVGYKQANSLQDLYGRPGFGGSGSAFGGDF